MLFHTTRLSAVLALLCGLSKEVQAQSDLRTASLFAVIASSAITNTGPTAIDGQIGIFPNDASSVTGFPPGTTFASNDDTSRAKEDARAVYIAARALYPTRDISGQDLGGLLLTPGTYFASSSVDITGALVLDGQNNQNAQFVFQIGSTLTTATSSAIVLINGVRASNVVWQIGSSATLGTGTSFEGNIIAQDSITLATGSTVNGGLYALTGAVTLDTNRITVPHASSQQPTGNNPPSANPISSLSRTVSRSISRSDRPPLPTIGASTLDVTISPLIIPFRTDSSSSLTTSTRLRDNAQRTSSQGTVSPPAATSPIGNITGTLYTHFVSDPTAFQTFSASRTELELRTSPVFLLPFTTTGFETTPTPQAQFTTVSDKSSTAGSVVLGTKATENQLLYSYANTVVALPTVPAITPTVSAITSEIRAYTGTGSVHLELRLGLLLLALILALSTLA